MALCDNYFDSTKYHIPSIFYAFSRFALLINIHDSII